MRSYDYIIVGAGSAGCVLANRLTHDIATIVLVIEAGGLDNQREVAVPAVFCKLFNGPTDWAYYTKSKHISRIGNFSGPGVRCWEAPVL